MNWLRKSLLWASVGYLGTATAMAQSPVHRLDDAAVTLCRPQPLFEPSAAAVRTAVPSSAVPAFVVRGQMDETRVLTLPSADDIVEPRVKPVSASQRIPDGAKPFSPVPSASNLQFLDGNRILVPAQPRTTVPQYNAWTGRVDGLPADTTQMVINDLGPPIPTFVVRAEYLQWWTRGYHLPVLVTTGAATTPEAVRGDLGQPDTVVLFGGDRTNQTLQSGARLMAVWNFDPCNECGLDGGYFFLGRRNGVFAADSSQFPVLARPFFNVNIGAQDRELTATPGLLPGDLLKLTGNVRVDNFTELQGAELNVRKYLCGNCRYSLYGLAGFRYLDLHEGLSITENVVSHAAVGGTTVFDPGNLIVVNDAFNTRNRFYGGQVGLDGELRRGRWFLGGRLQVAVGATQQTIDINGSQTVTTPAGGRSTFVGGLLALPSNIGTSTQNRFSVVPQVGLKVGYNLTDNLRVFACYDFLYWTNVVRPGDQIDTNLNVTQIPNFGTSPAFAPPSNIVRPIVPFATSSYFAHGFSAGLEWRY
jgi:hypothetical protein